MYIRRSHRSDPKYAQRTAKHDAPRTRVFRMTHAVTHSEAYAPRKAVRPTDLPDLLRITTSASCSAVRSSSDQDFRVFLDKELGLILKLRDMMKGFRASSDTLMTSYGNKKVPLYSNLVLGYIVREKLLITM
uniref:Uncharacterized protein n=1 Tax=Lactuca sativa TaxID=4236 RepID=A0A9R1UUV7_LACSA|nr:hypothetical protein LSAT_V11C800412580 [Lactuca sativa]